MDDNLAYIYEEESWNEMIDGNLVAMSPRPTVNHNIVASNIYRIFANYLKGKKCVSFADGTDLYLTKKDRFVPDGMIVCDIKKIKLNGVYGAPDLVIEVLSPNTAKNDKGHKKSIYEKSGVWEYWIVDPLNKMIEVYLLEDGKFILDEVYSIFPDYMLEKMTKEEQAAIPIKFKCSLFDDLTIYLEDVFERTF